MKVVIQRSESSSVLVNNKVVGSISSGMVILVGFSTDDTELDIDYIVKKIINLRIFDDENKVMNLSIKDVNKEILSISQFTLYADTTNGNRPSYTNAMNSVDAKKYYELFNEKLISNDIKVETGIFKEDMELNITNDGPVTIIIDSKQRL